MEIRRALAACALLALLGLGAADAQDLQVPPEDLRIEERGDGGFRLFVRARPGLGSVLLAESTKDPERRADNFAYRVKTPNPVNSGERRMLDGAFLPDSGGQRFIIDSSPAPDASLGSAFELFIPYVLEYGYPWSRSGEILVSDGTFFNIRAFALPYADYRGAWLDNPYQIRVTQRPFERPPRTAPAPAPAPAPTPAPAPEQQAEPDLSRYIPDTVEAFTDIASGGRGQVHFSEGAEDLPGELARVLDRLKGPTLDLVICLDTTDSMSDDIDQVKASLPGLLAERTARFERFRVGLVLYKDYYEEYVVKRYDFAADLAQFETRVKAIRVAGGRDIPEAVYEALNEAITAYEWQAADRLVILVGDAPPHALPRGSVTREMVEASAAAENVVVDVIILPH